MRPRNRQSKKCQFCKNIFGLDEPYSNIKNRKWCSRKCYIEQRGREKVGKKYLFQCSICKKKRMIDYKYNWRVKKSKIKICFICSRMSKGQKNSGSFVKGSHNSQKTEFTKENTTGKNHHNWKGGKSRDKHYGRKAKLWRTKVFKRDKFTCRVCQKKGVYLEAHHIKSWAEYPKLRYILSNGMTLCRICHKLTDSYAGKNKGKIIK